MTTTLTETYDFVALGVLHGEFSFSNRDEIEAKIKRKLARKKLGKYDQKRIDLLRSLKDEVQRELGLRPLPEPSGQQVSRYYVGRHGKYGDYTDFDIPRMTADLISRFPELPAEVVAWFVHYAVGTYYLL